MLAHSTKYWIVFIKAYIYNQVKRIVKLHGLHNHWRQITHKSEEAVVGLFLQGAHKLSEYFAKPYFHKYWSEIHYVTTIWKKNIFSFIVTLNAFNVRPTRVEQPQKCFIAQISGHTNYAQSVRQPFPSNTGLRFSHQMAIANIGPFQI
jgi:hypothetical protein